MLFPTIFNDKKYLQNSGFKCAPRKAIFISWHYCLNKKVMILGVGRALCLNGKQKFSALCSSGVVKHQGVHKTGGTGSDWFGAGVCARVGHFTSCHNGVKMCARFLSEKWPEFRSLDGTRNL